MSTNKAIEDITRREFGDNELLVGWTRGLFRLHGAFKVKDRKKHLEKQREVCL